MTTKIYPPTHPFVIVRQPDVTYESRYTVSIQPDGTEEFDEFTTVYRTKKAALAAVSAYLSRNECPKGMSASCFAGLSVERRLFNEETMIVVD